MRLNRLAAAVVMACVGVSARSAAPDVVLGGPEIEKLDWNTRALQAVDVDGDHLQDIVLANNDRSTVDILYQLKPGAVRTDVGKAVKDNRWEPVLADARFRKVSVTTGVTMYDLAVGDLNGDGRPDLAYTGDPQALTLQYQQADGTWVEKRLTEAPVPIQYLSGLRITDLNGDGRNDLVMLGQKEMVIYYQDKKGELGAPVRLPLPDENCYGLEIADVDGDGRPDILYLGSSARDTLRVRLQNAQGQFGPEQAYSIKDPRSTLQVLHEADGKSPAQFVFAQQRTGQLEFFNLEPAKDNAEAAALRPRIFAPRATVKTPSAYAFGDFNGDGREDVAVSDPDGAQVFIYFRQSDGGFTVAERYPTFSDARSLASGDWSGKGRADLIVASPKEQTVGIASVNADGRLGYPQPLPTTGRPLAVAAGDLSGDGKLSIVVVREEKGKRAFDIFTRGADGKPSITRTVEVNGLKTDPRGIRLVDANQDGRLDVVIFTPLDSMRLFLQGADGNFTEASAAAGFRKGLVDNLDASAFATGDLDGDGKSEMIVSTGAFARAVRVDGQGALTVVDQFNARDANAEISTAFVVPVSGKGKRAEVLLYDRKGEQFQRLRANAQGVYDVVDTVPAGKIDVVGSELRFAGKGRKQPELFVLGKDRFWWLPLERGDFTARSVDTYATDLPDINYSDVVAGDFTSGSRPELVAIDPDSNLLEILSWDAKAKGWSSRLHFKVFESDEHYAGKKGAAQEPRESIVADVTGDGKKDLVLLVHDRVLVYPQK
ncbi:MAG TPA: VCBS repeat-containing protein [Rariglobus sp.]|nr:VCBS repeat-containing protein [Rariglobus sp.]